MRRKTKTRVLGTVVVVAIALCVVSAASAKPGLSLSLALSKNAPKAHESVLAVVKSDFAPGRCDMKLLAVAPGVSRFRALDAFISGGVGIWGATGYFVRKLRPTPRMGFLVSLKQVRPKTWRTTIRFPRAGSWRLLVPNECGPGYMYPTPIDRVVTVR